MYHSKGKDLPTTICSVQELIKYPHEGLQLKILAENQLT